MITGQFDIVDCTLQTVDLSISKNVNFYKFTMLNYKEVTDLWCIVDRYDK